MENQKFIKDLVLNLDVEAKCELYEEKSDYFTPPYSELNVEIYSVRLNEHDVTHIFADCTKVYNLTYDLAEDKIYSNANERFWICEMIELCVFALIENKRVIFVREDKQRFDITDFLCYEQKTELELCD